MTTKEQIEWLDGKIDIIEKRMIARSEAFEKEQGKDEKAYKALCIERHKLCRQRIEEMDKEGAL